MIKWHVIAHNEVRYPSIDNRLRTMMAFLQNFKKPTQQYQNQSLREWPTKALIDG